MLTSDLDLKKTPRLLSPKGAPSTAAQSSLTLRDSSIHPLSSLMEVQSLSLRARKPPPSAVPKKIPLGSGGWLQPGGGRNTNLGNLNEPAIIMSNYQ